MSNQENKFSNGGFPPIKYCEEKVKGKIVTVQKERGYAPKNIPIRKILKTNSSKPVIDLDKNKSEKLDTVESI